MYGNVTYRASVLVRGAASDCVVTAYCALLRKFPDEGGYWHYLSMIEDSVNKRLEMIKTLHDVSVQMNIGVNLELDIESVELHPDPELDNEFLMLSLNARMFGFEGLIKALRYEAVPAAVGLLANGLEPIMQYPMSEVAILSGKIERIEAQISSLSYMLSKQVFGSTIREEISTLSARLNQIESRRTNQVGQGIDTKALDDLRQSLASYSHALFSITQQ